MGDERPLVVTQGDPLGVGPELILQLAADGVLRAGDIVVAGADRLRELATELTQPWAVEGWKAVESLLDEASPVGGLDQIAALTRGVDLVLGEPGRALVTAPIDKALAIAGGFAYPGHTEYLAARCGVEHVAMLMAGREIRVALATIHVPLRAVPELLSPALIVQSGKLLIEGLRRQFGIRVPRIGVLGLNPHAGEQGVLGQEEAAVIGPAIAALQQAFPEEAIVEGPLPADTAFHAHRDGRFDGLVAMYHDQGLGPFKLIHFTDGINITLGLPFVRTSPDHGTARDIAGQGIADPASMRAAVSFARSGEL